MSEQFDQAMEAYRLAAVALAEAETAEAEAFVRFRMSPGVTDGQAERMATVETRASSVVALAYLDIRKHQLDKVAAYELAILPAIISPQLLN